MYLFLSSLSLCVDDVGQALELLEGIFLAAQELKC